ncbi:MAG: 4Fe-4S dicluster domain-containing protein [Bacteroidia bacterium]|nr:4Fe-4S dicluster domain-containing protein [Bacteroidia bacterium]
MKITINNQSYDVAEGQTILQACQTAGIRIPTLCFLKDVSTNASCGICVVEVKGARSLLRSCITTVTEGMEITTHNERIATARRINTELLLANHPQDCLGCDRNLNCELQTITYEMGITDKRFVRTRKQVLKKDVSSLSLVRDPEKCILCGRCVAVCSEMQTVKAIDFAGRGVKTHIATYLDMPMGSVACTNCGQCALVCPTGAITEKSSVSEVWDAIHNPAKTVIVQTAPAIRVGIGEAMGMAAGSLVTGKMVAGLRRLGFSKVFDTNFTADLTIIEEGNELLNRIKTGGKLPMITSCSPGWIKFIEHFFPASLGHLSTCKSPQQMFGAVAKTYYAEKTGLDPRNIVVVSVMPCTAKKYEAKRPEMDGAFEYWKDKLSLTENDRFFDVDAVLTTRELSRMFRETGVDFSHLPVEEFDNPLGTSTGAAVIFGATGGVMEAALRTAYEVYTGKTLSDINFRAVRGMEGIREAEVDLSGTKIKVAVAHTLKNARILLEQIEKGESPYAFIEVMTCPGGCLGGGGQPIPTNAEVRKFRADSIYYEDAHKGLRKSHENPEILYLYEHFLKEPLGHLSHHLLHTTYTERGY